MAAAPQSNGNTTAHVHARSYSHLHTRHQRQLTLSQMEKLTGLRPNYISRALRGKFTPRLDKLKLLARAKDMDVHDLAHELRIAGPKPKKPRDVPPVEEIN